MEEKKKRGRPKKVVDPKVEQAKADDITPETIEKQFRDSMSPARLLTSDEPAKYQTTPMSNWAIENRKKKLGLKD